MASPRNSDSGLLPIRVTITVADSGFAVVGKAGGRALPSGCGVKNKRKRKP